MMVSTHRSKHVIVISELNHFALGNIYVEVLSETLNVCIYILSVLEKKEKSKIRFSVKCFRRKVNILSCLALDLDLAYAFL